MRRLTCRLLIVVSMLLASCATGPGFHADAPKQCGDTPGSAIGTFLEGIREFSVTLLRKVTPDDASLFEVFGNNDSRRGREVVRQISKHPEVADEGGSCACTLLSMSDTSDPQAKIAVLKREVFVGDDPHPHYYKWAFRVRFDMAGNCILAIDPIGSKWERM